MTTPQNVPIARHLLILEDQTARRMITLDEPKYTIGRHSSNSIILNSRKASRKHATLIKKTDGKKNKTSYWILDGDLDGNKSHNGIFINGEKCLVYELQDGDLINFGCEVNASYHLIDNGALGNLDSLADSPRLSISKDLSASLSKNKDDSEISQPNTLILSESHIDNSTTSRRRLSKDTTEIDDDTFQDQAYLDSLTNLPNRTLFNEYFSIALANARRNNTMMAVFLLDIAYFENVNETYGYIIGDQILQKVGQEINKSVRSSDIVARWEGDSFAILLPQLKNADNLGSIQQRILNNTGKTFQIDTFSIALTTHVGVAIYPQDGQEGQTLLTSVEQRLKANQKQPSHPPEPTLAGGPTLQSDRLTRVESRLHNALERGEFALFYQPQININTGDIEVMEAFVRWQHPERGLIAPHQFLPWAEQTDLIIPITQWILETACSQNQAWQASGWTPLPVSVNLSARQFQHPYFMKLLAETLSKTGLDPHWLELEITEKTMLQNIDLSRQVLRELQQLGVYLSLDDFGRGLVSIGYLQDLPFHKIKIDQSFIHQLTENPEDTAMIQALIALGKSFNLKVVAEGVETQQQLEVLHNLKCEAMQGYRFSQPLNTEQATQFLKLQAMSKTNH